MFCLIGLSHIFGATNSVQVLPDEYYVGGFGYESGILWPHIRSLTFARVVTIFFTFACI